MLRDSQGGRGVKVLPTSQLNIIYLKTSEETIRRTLDQQKTLTILVIPKDGQARVGGSQDKQCRRADGTWWQFYLGEEVKNSKYVVPTAQVLQVNAWLCHLQRRCCRRVAADNSALTPLITVISRAAPHRLSPASRAYPPPPPGQFNM